MNRPALGWSLGFLSLTSIAVALLIATCRRSGGDAAPSTPREESKAGEIDLPLILHKVREGDLLAGRNDLAGARRAWDEVRRIGGGHWAIHEGLGDSLARAKLPEEAAREYLAAEPRVPDRHRALREGIALKRAEALASAGRSLESLEALLEANQPGLLANRILETALKAPDESSVERALSHRALIFDPRVYSLLAAYYTKLHRKAEAAEATAQYVIAVAPWEETLSRQAIEGLRAAKKFDLAIEVCRAWIRSLPQAISVYQLMGDLLREAGREREAVVAYTSIVDVQPGDAQAHRTLGDIFKGLHRRDDAIAQYEAAKKARPEDIATWTSLLSLYEADGNSRKLDETLLEAAQRFSSPMEFRSKLTLLYLDRISKLKAEGRTAEASMLRLRLADLKVVEAGLYDLKIIITWDALSDVDLDVHEPGGEQVYHAHARSKAGGQYHADNTKGHGPEVYTLSSAPAGTYRVGAHLHGSTRSTVKFLVILFEDTPREERREETIVLTDSAPAFIRNVVIPR